MDYDDPRFSKYCYMPKEKESAVFDIDTIEEVKTDEQTARFSFKTKESVKLPDGTTADVDKPLGFYIRANLKDGRILSVTSLGAFNKTFKAHNIQDGEKVKITHLGRGEWEVEKLAGYQDKAA